MPVTITDINAILREYFPLQNIISHEDEMDWKWHCMIHKNAPFDECQYCQGTLMRVKR